MAETATTAAVDKRKRTRSPAYPFVNLETAILRAQEFFGKEQRNAANVNVAMSHWGFVAGSSNGAQTVAALASFGLLQDEGVGDKRKVRLTQNALRILLDERPDSKEREQLVKQAALAPKIHQQLWEKWGDNPPSDAQLRHTLLLDWQTPFNENAVDGFIREYRDTVAFARLSGSDRANWEAGDKGSAKIPESSYIPKVGDYVLWESRGMLQFSDAKRVREVSPDGKFAFVDGSYTGLPVSELARSEAPPSAPDPVNQESRMPLLLSKQMQEDVFSLSEGSVLLRWPTPLSPASIQDLKDWLEIVQRKISRAVSVPEEPPQS